MVVTEMQQNARDALWSDRCQYWAMNRPKSLGHAKKYNYREPLILCGHGIKIRVDHNTLFIRNGFTHYPQPPEEIRFFPGDANLPDRIVILDGDGGITFDALAWLSQQRIALVQLDWSGNIQTMGNGGFSANPKLVIALRRVSSGKLDVRIARWLIAHKITASVETLKTAFPKSVRKRDAISCLGKCVQKIAVLPVKATLSDVLGIEGQAAAAYFQTWEGQPLRWVGLRHRPIPESWREIGARRMSWRKRGRNARHPVNAMLNYGYGMLTSEVQRQVVAAGLDPALGIMHGNAQNRIPLVYDLMEPLRPVVDQKILKFAMKNEFTPADFTINEWGGCRLNPQMAKAVVRLIGNIDSRPFVAHVSHLLSQR